MIISLIVAIDQNHAIGREGDQLAYLSDDLKRFKQLTSGHIIVMGRKTFNALPKGALPHRRNIVLTRQCHLAFPGSETAGSVQEVLDLCQSHNEIFIIGGGEIYNLFFPLANRIYLTRIHHRFENTDTWFPPIIAEEWQQTSHEGPFTDAKSGLTFSFETLDK